MVYKYKSGGIRMKRFRNLIIVLVIVFAIVSPIVLPITGNVAVVEAATVGISQKSLVLEIGKTKVLKISGTKNKLTWKSSDKSVATVASNGKVTAKEVGMATITATVGGKKYSCTVTVAPYDAVEEKIGEISVIIPKDWDFESQEVSKGNFEATITPTELASNFIITTEFTGEKALTYGEVKANYSELTQDYVEQIFEEEFSSSEVEISDFKTFDYDSINGTVYATEYIVTLPDVTMKQTFLELSINNYFIEVTVTDAEELDLVAVAEYLLDSFKVNE